MKILRKSLLMSALVVAGASAVHAGPVLWVDDDAGRLGTIDVGTQTVTVIGTMSQVMTDIAFDPSGQLWGITFSNLYKIDKNTAATTLVGSTGLGNINSLVFASDGTLYTASNSGGTLYTLNTTTGAATSIGAIGHNSSGDLAFNGGTLYLSASASPDDNLVSIDTGTGAGAVVGSLGVNFAFGLATANNNVLYGVAGTGVYSVNTGSGAATLLFDYSGKGLSAANGSAFYTEAGAVVPLPSSVAAGLALGGAALLGRFVRRRRA